MLALESLRIVRYLRTLRGGSQPVLVQAADGFFYVVKFTNNLQGPNLLFNESAGSELFRSFGLSVPAWKPLLLTSDFLDHNSDCWMRTQDGVLRPHEGLCFGSRLVGEESQKVFEILSGAAFTRVRDRTSFWLARLLDVCGEHADNRQAVFVENVTGWLEASFIDHGHLFGGPHGTTRPHPQASSYLDPRIYAEVSSNELETLLQLPRTLNLDELWRRVNAVPEEWKTESARQGLERCLNRLATESLLQNVLETVVETHKRETAMARARNPIGFESEYPVRPPAVPPKPDWGPVGSRRWKNCRAAG
jgi:hypothetical protein